MDKKDYLKVLREFQNELKNITIDLEGCNENLDIQNVKKELKNDNKKHKYITIISLTLAIASYNTDFKMFFNFLIFFSTLGILGIISTTKMEKDLLENYKILDNISEKCKLEISKIENCIEFLNQTSEEELSKYLSYKTSNNH